MKFYEIIFSPTGGTKKAADILIHSLSQEIVEVDLCDRKADFSNVNLNEDDIALIAVPSYGGRVPRTAVERLETIAGKVQGRFLSVYMETVRMTILWLNCWMFPVKLGLDRLQQLQPWRNIRLHERLLRVVPMQRTKNV
ncbi:MAG: hypothetical protein LUF02_01930 [Erysipelotrichaceae bacterium]|nr:hypothetical protein [Erysipelotrichaceae bacterium]